MTTLKDARKKGNLEEFIKEHENDAPGDSDKLNKVIQTPLKDKSKPDQETSEKVRS